MNILRYYITRTRAKQAFFTHMRVCVRVTPETRGKSSPAPLREDARMPLSALYGGRREGRTFVSIDFCRILSYFVDVKTSRPQTLIPCALLALILLLSAALLPAGGHAFAQSFSVHAEDDAVVWQAYPGATSYIVEVTHPSGTATDAEFPGSATFAPFAALFDVGGEYTVTVYAVVNGERVASASLTYAHRVTLPAPTGFSFDGDILTWQQTNGATSYSVTVNGIDFGAVSDPAFSLGTILALTGEYTVTVTALGDEFNADSSPSSFVFPFAAPTLPPYDVIVSETGGKIFASWTPSAGETPECYVYKLISGDKVLVSEETAGNFVELTDAVTGDGEYVLEVYALSLGGESGVCRESFSVREGGLAS